MRPTLCLLHLLVTLLAFSHITGTKIIDYDNVEQNPYYRKSNLDLLVRRFCNFLQVKTTSTVATKTSKAKFSDRLVDALANLGMPIKNKAELPERVLEGLLGFIRAAHPGHELNKRNMTKEEKTRLQEILPDLIENLENEDGDVYDL